MKLNTTQDDENIKLTIKKGMDNNYGTLLEDLLRNYLNGKEIFIDPEYYWYFFGKDGENFRRDLLNNMKFRYAMITKVQIKSIWVMNELIMLHNSSESKSQPRLEDEIIKKVEELKLQKKTKSFHLKMSQKECFKLKKSTGLKDLKEDVKRRQINAKIEIWQSFNCMLILDSPTEHFIELRDKVKELYSAVQNELEKLEQSQKHKCDECGDIANLIRLLICKHMFCSVCLQSYYFKSITPEKLKKITELNQEILFCPKEKCGKIIAAADFFRVMSEQRVQEMFEPVYEQLQKSESFETLSNTRWKNLK